MSWGELLQVGRTLNNCINQVLILSGSFSTVIDTNSNSSLKYSLKMSIFIVEVLNWYLKSYWKLFSQHAQPVHGSWPGWRYLVVWTGPLIVGGAQPIKGTKCGLDLVPSLRTLGFHWPSWLGWFIAGQMTFQITRLSGWSELTTNMSWSGLRYVY